MGKTQSEVECAYLAGLLDGDGAIMAPIEPHPEKRFGFRVRVEVKVTQRFEKDVAWILEATGIGFLRKNLNTHEWIVRDQAAVAWLLSVLEPYVRAKREQLILAKKIIDHPKDTKEQFVQVAHLADALSKFNVRSSGRRKNTASMVEDCVSRND